MLVGATCILEFLVVLSTRKNASTSSEVNCGSNLSSQKQLFCEFIWPTYVYMYIHSGWHADSIKYTWNSLIPVTCLLHTHLMACDVYSSCWFLWEPALWPLCVSSAQWVLLGTYGWERSILFIYMYLYVLLYDELKFTLLFKIILNQMHLFFSLIKYTQKYLSARSAV